MSGVLVFVEDPGAANFARDLPAALMARGHRAQLFAEGAACGYLRDRGVRFAPLGARDALLEAPDAIVVGTAENPDTDGLRLAAEARGAGIPSVGLVDAAANAEHRFRGREADALAFAPDWILVPDEPTRRRFVALGHDDARVVAVGNPHWDAVRDRARDLERAGGRQALRRRLFPDVPSERPLLVFASEVSTGVEPGQFRRSPDYTLDGRGERHGRTEIVLEELLDAARASRQRPHLVLRLHPKNTREELGALLAEVDEVSESGDPLELLLAADAVVGMTSSLLLEAALMGTPALSVVPRAAELGWLPEALGGAIATASSRTELTDALGLLLTRPARSAPAELPEGALGAAADVIDTVVRAA